MCPRESPTFSVQSNIICQRAETEVESFAGRSSSASSSYPAPLWPLCWCTRPFWPSEEEVRDQVLPLFLSLLLLHVITCQRTLLELSTYRDIQAIPKIILFEADSSPGNCSIFSLFLFWSLSLTLFLSPQISLCEPQ